MIHKNQNIPIVVKFIRPETPGYLSIIFERPVGFEFKAGDWMDLGFVNPDIRGGTTYSFSSSPTEPDLMITFREGVSEVKRTLQAAKAGDTFSIVQYGNDYGFHLREHTTATLIAGGVGVAPFRSMIKEMADTDDKSSIDLLYFNSSADFLFQEEINQWKAALPSLGVQFVVTRDLKKKDKVKILAGIAEASQRSYYIAGPDAMVESTEHTLIEQGVKFKDIKIDSFGSY
ncbi:MAG: FAD-binding oxidoreductase [Candidatus Saccharibacteria bacterium]|nr:FAD-binding oxidoreductase [Candidatus Saccharibacteria bacterium]